MRIAVTSIGVALTLAVAAACSSAGGGGSRPATLDVGEFNPFSGHDAVFGLEMAGGCFPAVRSINAAGGVLKHRLTCLEEDTKGDPADALSTAEQMMATRPHLIGVLGPSSDEALATVPVLNRGHVPMFVDTGQAAYDHAKYPYFWRITPADDVKGYALALWAHQHGYTRAAAIFGNDAGAQSDVPTLVSAFTKLGGTITYNKPLALDQTSYRTEIENMLAGHPQVIFTEVDPQTGATFLSELQQLHGLIPVIGTEVSLQAPWLNAVKGAIGAGAMAKYFTGMQPFAPAKGPAWEAYNKSLLASAAQVPKPSQWSTDPYSMTYYDGVVVMALAMIAANSTDPSVFNSYITQVTEPGSGKTVVYTYAAGKAALRAGKQIQYWGAGGPIAFNFWHNSSGAFEAAQYVSGQPKIVGRVTAQQIAQLSK
jgi:branched-chain amino acid transport system substrate-binding protein/neutral amino acid transport system substrate-binding protein